MHVLTDHNGVPIKAFVGDYKGTMIADFAAKPGPDIETAALRQLQNIASLPFIHHHVAAMPDVHLGFGATVGSVVPTAGAIIPAAVGVDIGCGMMAVRLDGVKAKDFDERLLRQIHSEIRHTVPTGFDRHQPGTQNERVAHALYEQARWLEEKHPTMFAKRKDPMDVIVSSQFGSLGGGNHFIEICLDESDEAWVMLHSGSRGIGNLIGHYFTVLAKDDMRRHFINLPDDDLAYFPEGTEHFEDYVRAVGWAQNYAMANRDEMMRRILIVLRRHLPPFRHQTEAINCHHNYVELENHFGKNVYLTRKGAIRARLGDMGIIPGSMGARSYIVRGKGNPDSFQSCSHGAGRKMGRKEAERQLSTESLHERMQGIVWMEDNRVLDEHPDAYKDIDEVMENQKDLVEVVHTLKQILNVKGLG